VKQLLTEGIILSRTDYGEADRIITLLTPEHGKLRLMAKGVRKVKSKLAGGIELFSVSHITFIQGKSDVGTLISTRLIRHYGHIVKNIDRVQLGYELIKMLNKATEDEPEPEYFTLMDEAFAALDDVTIDEQLIKVWFQAQLLKLAGHSPNLTADIAGSSLDPGETYTFDFDKMALAQNSAGQLSADHIKYLRLLFSSNPSQTLAKVQGSAALLNNLEPLMRTIVQAHLRT